MTQAIDISAGLVSRFFAFTALGFWCCATLTSCRTNLNQIRVGYSPNLTHAQVLIGSARGDFQEALGAKISIDYHVFNAGPAIIEALFAGAIDLAYVGPNPAINSFVRSHGEFVVLAGSANGGAALVVAKNQKFKRLSDFKGAKIATPQLGNTQDINARTYFGENGFNIKDRSGDVVFLPVANPDQLNLFRKKDIQAAWTVEPWVSRLVQEEGARIFFDEQKVWAGWTGESYPTTLVVVRKKFLETSPHLVSRWLEAHVRITGWMNRNPLEARDICNSQIERFLGKPLAVKTLESAWHRVQFSWKFNEKALERSFLNAQRLGYLRGSTGTLSGLFLKEPLNGVLKSLGESS